jgi:hypothetical protein
MAAAFIQAKKRQQNEFKQAIVAAEEGMDSFRSDKFDAIAHPESSLHTQIRRSLCSDFSNSSLCVALSSRLHISLRSDSLSARESCPLSRKVEERDLAPSTARPFKITQVQGSRVKAPASTKSPDTTPVSWALPEKQSLEVVACYPIICAWAVSDY